MEVERQTALERSLFPLARIMSDDKVMRASHEVVARESTVSDYYPNNPGPVHWSTNPLNPDTFLEPRSAFLKEDCLEGLAKAETRSNGSEKVWDVGSEVPAKKQRLDN